ncbi:MAG: acetyl-CoA C-acyltransferase [Gammaproteobacteria bacterium]|nr:MAG: acetyl-CoA C-acyltransferase [Gammaproteobacteria bacterium]
MTQIRDDDVLVIEGARTPWGRFLGGLRQQSATQLAITAARGAIERSALNPECIDSVILGNVLQTSSDAAYLPRHVGLEVGAPIESDALIVSRACGSALEATIQAAKSIRLSEANILLVGGTENMSLAPYVIRNAREGLRMGHQPVEDSLMQSLFDAQAGCAIGQTVDALAKEYKISRAAADEAALKGQEKSYTAQQRGIYAEEIMPVTCKTHGKETLIDTDESLRPHITKSTLAALPPLFSHDGVVTAGNSTGLTDGAAVTVMASGTAAKQQNLTPLGRIVSWGVAGVPPLSMGIGPVAASEKALKMAGLTINDMDVVELNDSFSVQYLAVEKNLGLNPDKVNPNGGAIALGHPMGATGSRLIISALYQLRRTQQRYGLCTVCIGGGQGIAVIVENLVR